LGRVEKGWRLDDGRDRRAGLGQLIRLEHAAHRPDAVAQGARELQAVPSPSGPGELEPGSGHGAGQGPGTPEPIAWVALVCPASICVNMAPQMTGFTRERTITIACRCCCIGFQSAVTSRRAG